MSDKNVYRQCRMEKPTAKGKLIHTAYIPARFAHVGKTAQRRRALGWALDSR